MPKSIWPNKNIIKVKLFLLTHAESNKGKGLNRGPQIYNVAVKTNVAESLKCFFSHDILPVISLDNKEH